MEEIKNKIRKCPKCNSECWRDEHPDGIIAGNWSCSDCDWFEEDKRKHAEECIHFGNPLLANGNICSCDCHRQEGNPLEWEKEWDRDWEPWFHKGGSKEWIYSKIIQAKKEGVEEERERIIKVLEQKLIKICECGNGGCLNCSRVMEIIDNKLN